MLTNPTIETLKSLKLQGLLEALEEQQRTPPVQALSFEERLALLVDRERLWRENQRRTRLLRGARLKVVAASVEDIDYKAARGLDKRQIATLATGEWIRRAQNLLITGATGSGKTWIACALAQQTCRQGRSVLYWRVPRLIEELRIAHGDGSYIRFLKTLSKASLIVLDDWGSPRCPCRTGPICWKSSMIASTAARRSSPASCPWRLGTPTLASPRWRTRSWIVWYTRATALS